MRSKTITWDSDDLLLIWLIASDFDEVCIKTNDYLSRKFIWQYRVQFVAHFYAGLNVLIHWGRVAHICVIKLTIVGSDNGLSPGQCQAIFWTNADILLIWPLGTNFNEIFIEIHIFSFKNIWKCRLRNGGHFASVSMCQVKSKTDLPA